MYKDLLNFSFIYRILIAFISVVAIRFLSIQFSSEVANKFLLIFSSSGIFAVLSLGVNDKIAFDESNKAINKPLFLFYSLSALFCILISQIIQSEYIAIFAFVFIYPLITFDRIFQNSGENILAYTIQASLSISLLFYLLLNNFVNTPFFFFPLLALLVIVFCVFYFYKKIKIWNNTNPFVLVKLNFIIENIQFTFLFGLDIILSSFFNNSIISNQFIILNRFFSLFQMIIFIIPNNYYLVINGTYDFTQFYKRYFNPILILLIIYSIFVYVASPYLLNFFLPKTDAKYTMNIFFYIIIFIITSLTTLLGSLNTIFVKRNQLIFREFIKKQNYVLVLIVFLMISLYFNYLTYVTFLFLKASIIIFFTFYLTYRIKNEVRNNNT